MNKFSYFNQILLSLFNIAKAFNIETQMCQSV